MAGLQNVLSAIAQIGVVSSAAAAATREATDERKKYNAAVEDTARISTAAGVTNASPNRDGSSDVGATSSPGGSSDSTSTAAMAAALQSTRGRI